MAPLDRATRWVTWRLAHARRSRPWWTYNVTMKDINVTELKSHLSRYLRLASRGARIVVNDRNEPIAEIGPPRADAIAWHDRLARQGRLRPGTQNWARLKISRVGRRVDIQASLGAVREDPSEVRQR